MRPLRETLIAPAVGPRVDARAVYAAHRGNPVVHADRCERRILSWTQDHTPAGELDVIADLPGSALHDDRGGTIRKAQALEVGSGSVDGDGPALEILAAIERDL